MEEYLQRPEGRLPLLIRPLPDLVMFVGGVREVQRSVIRTLRMVGEELERRR